MFNNFRLLAFSVFVPTLLVSFSKGLLLPVLPVFVSSFEVSYGLVGLVLSMEAVGTLVGDIPAGSLLRYIDKKWVMLLGLVIMGVATLVLVWATNIWLVLVFRFISGLGNALNIMSLNAYLADYTRKHERGRVIAMFGGINRMGQFIGPALGGLLASRLGLVSPFAFFAGFCLFTAISTLLFVRLTPSAEGVKKTQAHPHLLKVLAEHKGIFMSAGLGMLFAQMIREGRKVIIPLFGADVLGLDIAAVGLIMSIGAAIDMSLFYPAGFVMDRWGRKFAIVPSFLLQAVGMALVPLSGGFLGLTLCSALMGLGNGMSSGTMMTLGTDLAPRDSLGEFLGVWRFIGDAGGTGGPLAVGAVATLLSLGASALVLGLIGTFSALVFAYLVPETLKRRTA
ncbi:MAG: MFS transporter [Trueperaceae bacterium]|nr:MFS transporter [Trueperaceae bacterium]